MNVSILENNSTDAATARTHSLLLPHITVREAKPSVAAGHALASEVSRAIVNERRRTEFWEALVVLVLSASGAVGILIAFLNT
jgi:hypothetical protein